MKNNARDNQLGSLWSFWGGVGGFNLGASILQKRGRREGTTINENTERAFAGPRQTARSFGGHQRDTERNAVERGRARLEKVCKSIKEKRDKFINNGS